MASDPYGNQATPRRRGFGFGGIRWWVLLLFAGYAGYYWISNRSTDALTGETVLIDKSISPEDEKQLGLQAWDELLKTERQVDPNDPNARAVREIAQRLIVKIPQVSPLPTVVLSQWVTAIRVETSWLPAMFLRPDSWPDSWKTSRAVIRGVRSMGLISPSVTRRCSGRS